MKNFILLFLALVSLTTQANYYDSDTLNEIKSGSMKNEDLLRFLGRTASKGFHGLGYSKQAKKFLFGDVDLKEDSQGYFVLDVYCNYEIRQSVGPGKIPANETMNVEHTWPQSKGAKAEPARGDLHHLFPADSKANSKRGNFPFGEIAGGSDARSNCEISQSGKITDPKTGKSSGVQGFEPPIEHRGNVARAMFYVSAKYRYEITEIEEYYLRKWHHDDPVDQEEISRNDRVESAQGNRNPFIDFPELESRIDNF